MSPANNKELAESKLILLYIINKLSIPVSNLQITKLVLENKFMNYFFLQQFLNELCDNNMLSSRIIESKIFYTITETGKQTLGYFPNIIPFGIKAQIDSTLALLKKNMRNETLITAEFIPESENEYSVHCSVNEDNFCLVDLKLTVGTKNDARTICDNWRKNSQAIYSEIIDSVMKKRS